MNTHKRTSKKIRRGIGLIWAVIFLMVLVAVAGLVVDFARAYFTAHQLQNAADSAALVGSRFVGWDPNSATKSYARQMAFNYASLNEAAKQSVYLDLNEDNAPDGDIVVGRYIDYNQSFVLDIDTPDAMLVFARRDGSADQKPRLPLVFASIFGVSSSTIQKYAIAKAEDIYDAGIIALGEYDDRPGLEMKGTASSIDVANGGTIHVNSFYSDAFAISGQPGIEAERMDIAGGCDSQFIPPDDLDIHSDTKTVVVDPYKALAEPALYLPTSATAPADGTSLKITTGDHNLLPGYYPGGIDCTGGNITLQAGIYQVGGIGLNVTGNTIMTGADVMFHIVDTGYAYIGGGGNDAIVSITAPSSGDYQGIVIFQSRDPDGDGNALNNPDSTIIGNNELNLDGVIYMPKNHLELGGTGDGFGTRLIADTILVHGTGLISVNYQGKPKIAETSYLVE